MTNVFYQSPEPTCLCKKCKVSKHYADMVPRAGGGKNKNGVRPICKTCRKAQQQRARILSRAATVERINAENETLRNDTQRTPPRTYNTGTTPWVPQDTTYCRNNGNKHIPSRGISA